MYMPNRFIGIIYRDKLHGVGKHAGVMLPDGTVIDITQDCGIRFVSFEEFAHGKQVTAGLAAHPSQYAEMQSRANQALEMQRPYDIGKFNCEHFAMWIVGEKPKSDQLVGFTFIAAAVAALYIMERHSPG